MSQRITDHPLRKIVLEYDDSKPETDYEKELFRHYILIHDEAFKLRIFAARLLYEYQNLDDRVTEAGKVFSPVPAEVDALLQEAKVLTAFELGSGDCV